MRRSLSFLLQFLKLVIGATALYAVTRVFQAWKERFKLRHVPSVGPSAPLLSYYGALQFFKRAPDVLHNGYQKYRGHVFKIPLMTGWVVAVSGRDRVEELRKASDDVVSFQEAVNEMVQIKYTLGEELATDPYHVDTVRAPLTRNIATRFDEVQDEIEVAFAEHIPATEQWSSVKVLEAAMDITCRTSNRLFVGLPLCRDKDWIKLNIDFAVDLIKSGQTLSLFPAVLRPYAARFFATVKDSIEQALVHLGADLENRIDNDAKYGPKWEGRPNDLISWLMDSGEEHHKNPRNLVVRLFAINSAAIHTTSMTFTQVLFDLAKHPEYIPILREEVEAIVKEEGITKASLLRMVKVDSFVKESQRVGGILALTLQRILLEDFTFSDGLTLPKGTYVAVPNIEMQMDEEHYQDPNAFDGLRYVKMAGEGDTFNKHSIVALSTDFMIFGHGRHACPGRFFAANEIKAFLVHILMNYDIMLDPDSPSFKNFWFNASAVPDPNAMLKVRKRRT